MLDLAWASLITRVAMLWIRLNKATQTQTLTGTPLRLNALSSSVFLLPHFGMHSERVQQVHGQRSDRSRRHAAGAGQVDPHGAVPVNGLHQDAHGQREAVGVGAVRVTQQCDLIIRHA